MRSADNDGLNDGFLPLGSGYVAESYSFMVFNRWGNLVFKSDNPDEAWIGQNNQRQGTHYVPAGVQLSRGSPRVPRFVSYGALGLSDCDR